MEPGREVVLVNTPVELLSDYAFAVLEGPSRPHPPPLSLHQLYAGTSELWLERVDAHTLDVTATSGWGRVPFERIFCPPEDMPRPGTEVRVRGLLIRVLTATPEGMPETVRFTFDGAIDAEERQWLVWEGTTPVPFTPPAVGQRVRLPPLFVLAPPCRSESAEAPLLEVSRRACSRTEAPLVRLGPWQHTRGIAGGRASSDREHRAHRAPRHTPEVKARQQLRSARPAHPCPAPRATAPGTPAPAPAHPRRGVVRERRAAEALGQPPAVVRQHQAHMQKPRAPRVRAPHTARAAAGCCSASHRRAPPRSPPAPRRPPPRPADTRTARRSGGSRSRHPAAAPPRPAARPRSARSARPPGSRRSAARPGDPSEPVHTARAGIHQLALELTRVRGAAQRGLDLAARARARITPAPLPAAA
jgi:hypothetical protein